MEDKQSIKDCDLRISRCYDEAGCVYKIFKNGKEHKVRIVSDTDRLSLECLIRLEEPIVFNN